MGLYMVWSHEHGAWWKPLMGYTPDAREAMRFERATAIAICAKANAFLKPEAPPHEVPVSVEDAEAAGVFRVKR